MAWEVHVEPYGKNPSPKDGLELTQANAENLSGMIVYLVNGTKKEEVTRVAYARRASKNPSVSFQDQLHQEIEKAKVAAETLNEHTAGAGKLS